MAPWSSSSSLRSRPDGDGSPPRRCGLWRLPADRGQEAPPALRRLALGGRREIAGQRIAAAVFVTRPEQGDSEVEARLEELRIDLEGAPGGLDGAGGRDASPAGDAELG